MTSKDIIKANIGFSCEERIGFCFDPQVGRYNDFKHLGYNNPVKTERWEDDNFQYYTDIWGNVWHKIKGMSAKGEVFTPVLEDWGKLDDLQLPDLDNPDLYVDVKKHAQGETELFVIGYMPWPFEVCRYMRKMDVYFMDLILEREKIDILHDRVTSLLEGVIDRYAEAQVDGVMFCEDLGVQDRTLMSPQMWRDIFRPLYERLTSRAHSHGLKVIQHSCGNNRDIIDDLCESGINCLQFDQPLIYDVQDLSAKLKKHKVGLFSPCDIQKVLPTGDRSLIERATEELVNTFRGGLIATGYGDLHGIGVKPEWDKWAYDVFVKVGR
ncbi:MAG: hypothetical protein GX811_10920 [Lentisphaerae bacterium]|jgi:hypothetical protein|nr:hypothetical protein [Lentisphaerota bacterium]